jgi:hypothetical protein
MSGATGLLPALSVLLFVFCFVLGWRQPVLKARIGRWLVGAAGLLLAQIVMGGLTVLIVHKGDGDPTARRLDRLDPSDTGQLAGCAGDPGQPGSAAPDASRDHRV